MGATADRLNRVLLALLGLLLLAAGVAALLPGLGAFGERVQSRRVFSSDAVSFVEDNARWLAPLVAVLALLLALLAMRWLLRQLRTDRVDALDLTEQRNRGETQVDAAALTSALEDAVERCPGVSDAHARVVDVKGREQLLVEVRLADRADIAVARRCLAEGPLIELRQALGDDRCPPVRVELAPSTKGMADRALA
jgi:hypothetical protein